MRRMPIRRVLAIDIRSRRAGWVVLEAARLLDWGVRKNIGHHGRDGTIVALLRMFQPSVVVVRRIKVGGRRDTPRARSIRRAIRSDARCGSVPVVYLGDAALKKCFRTYGKKTKYAIASSLAACFPELKLPPRRKIWKAEHPRMCVFDALQLGVAFLVLQASGNTVQNLLSNNEPFRRPLDDVAK